MTRVLILRPEPGASASAERARSRGLDAFAIPLFEVEPVSWKVPKPERFDALLLTSANAVRNGGDQLRTLRTLEVYAVGEQTAKEARRAGFRVAEAGKAGVDDLLSSIAAELKLLHLCGADYRLPARAEQEITRLIVYRSIPIERPDLSTARNSVALIHSPRAARRFAELVSDRAATSIAAISEVAARAAGSGWKRVEVAERPTDDGLLALAARLCNKPE